MASSITPGIVLFLAAVSTSAAELKVDFNHDIRPLLSNTCFRCHGPDEAERKAKLRLDTREGAMNDLGGYAAVVPGDASASALLERVRSTDPDEVMPPPEAGKALTAEEVALLERWIEQDAPYAKHWAYTKRAPVTPPEVKDAQWPKGAVDHFILGRLETEGLAPSAEANRHVLARRVALDLTGLPPFMDEVERFVQSDRPDAYEALVDGLLEKEAFGEHWARHWLDLARYADSAGYADDPARTIWGFRDYVIRSFNENKPFDVFSREQLAGDLLPDPTMDQLVATAFHRNTQTNNEGGTNDEEFRNVAVVDRVNTTFAVWMGTTMACAQCHTHKYDPITQKEYFEAFAIFNNTQDADRRDESPRVDVATPAFIQKKEAKRSELKRLEEAFVKPDKEVKAAFEAWQSRALGEEISWKVLHPKVVEARSGRSMKVDDTGMILAGESKVRKDTYEISAATGDAGKVTAVRLEVFPDGRNVVLNEFEVMAESGQGDAAAGRYVRIDLKGEGRMIHIAELQAFSGEKNVALQGKATQSSQYADAVAARAIDGNTDGQYHKGSVSHTGVNDSSPWWEVDLGAVKELTRLVVWNRTDGTIGSRLDGFQLSVLDADRSPVWSQTFAKAPEKDLAVALDGNQPVTLRDPTATFAQSKFGVEKAIDGDAKQDSGWALAPELNRPHAAVFQLASPVEAATLTFTLRQQYPKHPLRKFRLSVTTADQPVREWPQALRAILEKPSEERSAKEAKQLYRYFAKVDPALKAPREALDNLRKEIAEMKAPTSVPIMRDLEEGKQRETHIQLRGNYLMTGDQVGPGLPSQLHGAPDGELDRLALADWIMDPDNPLTARVTANRFWEAIFGIGLVRTSEEFGSQGDLPSHPELLDWLANELVRNEWDIKGFLKMLVTSAAYRQTSKVTPALIECDPDNRLLARGPRFRLSAEMVRDQALYVSGLLSDKMYGKPVQPRQPNIGLNAAFGGGIDWKTSEGEDQYRRGIYTMWRRSNPYPSMAAFDAPNREVCTVRRDRTNTPLQALVTLNDPVYMEAAQALARDLVSLSEGPEETVNAAFLKCLSRPAKKAERQALAKLYAKTLARVRDDPKRASALATDPLGPAPEGADLAELAAWSVVSNVILNVDEIFLKP